MQAIDADSGNADAGGEAPGRFVLPRRTFLIGGAQYPADFPWTGNIRFVRHMPPPEHPARPLRARSSAMLRDERTDIECLASGRGVRIRDAAAARGGRPRDECGRAKKPYRTVSCKVGLQQM